MFGWVLNLHQYVFDSYLGQYQLVKYAHITKVNNLD